MGAAGGPGVAMMVQARAEATRRKIIDAAVDLFADVGYSDTDLRDIVTRSEMTKGAFYYHFSGKEALASAIIEEAETEFREVVIVLLMSAPALENLVRSTFVVVDMHTRDKLTRVANQLRPALSQVSPNGARTYRQRQSVVLKVLTDTISRGIDEGDLLDDVNADEVAHTLWSSTLGNRILADATGDDIFGRLAEIWRVLLRGIATARSGPYLQQFATRMAQQYARGHLPPE